MKDKMKNMLVFYLFTCILNVYLIKYVGVFLTVNYCVDHKENFQKAVSFGFIFRLKTKLKGIKHALKFILHGNKYSA